MTRNRFAVSDFFGAGLIGAIQRTSGGPTEHGYGAQCHDNERRTQLYAEPTTFGLRFHAIHFSECRQKQSGQSREGMAQVTLAKVAE